MGKAERATGRSPLRQAALPPAFSRRLLFLRYPHSRVGGFLRFGVCVMRSKILASAAVAVLLAACGGSSTPKFEAAAPQYDWMRNCVFIGTLLASADGTRVEMAFYAVT